MLRRIKKKLSQIDELWCELALSLGGTIGELQSKMGYREFDLWCRYRNKYGPLNPVRMYDQGHALTASQVNNAHGGKAKPLDFMPYGKEAQEPPTVEEFIKATFGNGVRIGKRKRR